MLDSETIKNNLGIKLKDLRVDKGITQEQLAEFLGLQPHTITKIETGRAFISSNVLAKICNFFQIEPYVLFLKKHQTYTPEELNHISEINSKLNKIYNILTNNKT